MASMLYAAAPANAAIHGDTAAKDTVHGTAETGKNVAHGTTKAADKTTHTMGHVAQKNGIRDKKGRHCIGHGVKKGATQTVDALK